MKKLIIILSTFISATAFSQNYDKTNFAAVGFAAGYSLTYNEPTATIQLGYRAGNVYISADELIDLSKKSYVPEIFKLNAGYNAGQIQPFISFSYQTIGAENEAYFKDTPYQFLNGYRIGAGLSYYFKNIPLVITGQKQGKETNFSILIYTAL